MVVNRKSWPILSVTILCAIIIGLVSGPVLGETTFIAANQSIALQLRNLPFTIHFNLANLIPGELGKQFQSSLTQVMDQIVLPKIAPGDVSARFASISAETRLLKQTEKGFQTQVLLTLLRRDVFMAEPALLTYDNINGKAENVVTEYPYQIRAELTRSVLAAALIPELQAEKQKSYALKTDLRSPDDPSKFNYNPAIDQAYSFEMTQVSAAALVLWNAKALANTACDMFPSAVEATKQIHAIFYNAGLSAARRIGPQSTKTEINNFLYNDKYLLAWSNIGHGVTSSPDGSPCYGLSQWGATQWASEFATGALGKGLYWCVGFTNSCNSFIDPLKSSILRHRPRTYIGGRILLPVNKSEWADRDFWYWTLTKHNKMDMALQKASVAQGLAGKFGLTGGFGLAIASGLF